MKRQWRFFILRLFLPFINAVGFIMFSSAIVAINPHRAIAMETMIRTFWAVDRYLSAVHSEAVSLGVAIREQSSLQHPIGRKANSRHNVSGIESSLLYIRKIIFGVTV